jgi:hypothetical protein
MDQMCTGTYLRFSAEPTEELVRFEAAFLVWNDTGHSVHETGFGLFVESHAAHRIVGQHAGQQMLGRRLIHSLVHCTHKNVFVVFFLAIKHLRNSLDELFSKSLLPNVNFVQPTAVLPVIRIKHSKLEYE